MITAGEADWLVAERVWQETCNALAGACPATYFLELERLGALAVIMPELAGRFGHQDSLSARTLTRAAQAGAGLAVRFACAAVTPGDDSVSQAEALSRRLKVPTECRDMACLSARVLPFWMTASMPSTGQRLRLLQTLDAFRRPQRFEQVLAACSFLQQEAETATSLSSVLQKDLESCQAVEPAQLVRQGFKGKALGEAIDKARLEAMDAAQTAGISRL